MLPYESQLNNIFELFG